MLRCVPLLYPFVRKSDCCANWPNTAHERGLLQREKYPYCVS